MRIALREPDRLHLTGVPGGAGWMLAASLIGGSGSIAAVYGIVDGIRDGRYFGLIFIGVGLLIAQAIFWLGLITTVAGRERLELDRRIGRGRYSVRSPIVSTSNRSFSFDLDDVDSVTMEHALERISGSTASDHASTREHEVYRVRLRIGGRSRRAVMLRESGSGDITHLQTLAREVAAFLSREVVEIEEGRCEAPSDAQSDCVTTHPRRADPIDFNRLDLPPQPEPAEWAVTPTADGSRIEITRKKRGGPAVFGLFLLLLSLFGIMTLVFAVGAWLTDTTSDGRPLSIAVRIGLTIPGLVAGVVVPWAWIALLRGRRVIFIDEHALTAAWEYPGRGVVARVPGLRGIFARGERVEIGRADERPVVRTIRASEGRVVEVRAGGRRARIGSSAATEEAEDASLKWLGRTLRAILSRDHP